MADQKYIRLTRERSPQSFSFTAVSRSRSSLWLGDDHILLVENGGITENYKRFYFRDIQAISIRQTVRRKVWNWVLSAPLMFCLCYMIFFWFDARGIGVEDIMFVSIVSTVVGIPLLLNNIFGTTCVCQIRTAVQTEELASLSRVRKTRKVLERLRPLIIAAQGEISADEVAVHLRGSVPPLPAYSGPPVPPLLA